VADSKGTATDRSDTFARNYTRKKVSFDARIVFARSLFSFRTYEFHAGSVENVALRASRIEWQKQQRPTPVDPVVADADEVTAYCRHCAFNGIVSDELSASSRKRFQRHVARVSYL
jgi:hypothetical protein